MHLDHFCVVESVKWSGDVKRYKERVFNKNLIFYL